MKYPLLMLAAALACASSSASAVVAPFGCDARAPDICYFRIFYSEGRSRDVVLPAGMKQKIPEVEIDRGQYCVSVNVRPRYKCRRKTVSGAYNN
jgi:hypothetical protein